MCSLIIISRNIGAAIFLMVKALVLVKPTLNGVFENRSSNLSGQDEYTLNVNLV